jgi:hypothetical protein
MRIEKGAVEWDGEGHRCEGTDDCCNVAESLGWVNRQVS